MKQNYYPKEQIKEVFSEPGIYRLFTLNNYNLNLVYIGKSVNLRKRLMEHNRTPYMEFAYFDYEFYPKGKISEVEKQEISLFEQKYGCLPQYNNQRG